MKNGSLLRELALELKRSQDAATQVEPLTTRIPAFDLTAAYEVAKLIHQERVEENAKPIGRKIGFTNRDMWPQFAVRAPIWAYTYDTTVVELRDARTTCPLGKLVEPRIEPEIVFKLRAIPARGAGLQELLDAVEWMAHGFEIVQSHFPGWKFQAADAVADSGLHGRLLVGPPLARERFGREVISVLKSFTISLACDDRHVATGSGANVLGSPLGALSDFLELLASEHVLDPPRVGDIITTGTITGAHPVHAGQTWRSQVQGIALPGLEVRFTE